MVVLKLINLQLIKEIIRGLARTTYLLIFKSKFL